MSKMLDAETLKCYNAITNVLKNKKLRPDGYIRYREDLVSTSAKKIVHGERLSRERILYTDSQILTITGVMVCTLSEFLLPVKPSRP